MWNMVSKGGKKYHVDLTNDDDNNPDRISYDLFMTHPDSGSVTEKYYYNCSNVTISYSFDDEMFAVFGEPMLTIALKSDEPGDEPGGSDIITGDLNADGAVSDQDAVYLLFYTFFPDDYPVNQPVDLNGDGAVNDQDAVYLLFYTFFPEDYPLATQA